MGERAQEVENRLLCTCGGRLKYESGNRINPKPCSGSQCTTTSGSGFARPLLDLKAGPFWVCTNKKCSTFAPNPFGDKMRYYCFDCKPKVNPNDLDRDAVDNLWPFISAPMPG